MNKTEVLLTALETEATRLEAQADDDRHTEGYRRGVREGAAAIRAAIAAAGVTPAPGTV